MLGRYYVGTEMTVIGKRKTITGKVVPYSITFGGDTMKTDSVLVCDSKEEAIVKGTMNATNRAKELQEQMDERVATGKPTGKMIITGVRACDNKFVWSKPFVEIDEIKVVFKEVRLWYNYKDAKLETCLKELTAEQFQDEFGHLNLTGR